MKNFKILSIAMLSLAAFCFASCGDDDVEEQKPKDGTEKPEKPEDPKEPEEPEETEETSTTANLLTENGYYDGLMYYKITSNSPLEVCVAKADEVAVTIEIPMVVMIDEKKYSCTSIGEKAFSECKKLTSVTIPNSVTNIGGYSFSECTSLTSITIPNSVTSIGEYAFWGCTSLASITIPNSVTSIEKGAFYGCTSLASVTIPNSVTSIGAGAFWGCTTLASITIPNSVTSIGERAFSGCTSLASVTIPNSVTSIGGEAFSGCTGNLIINCDIPDGGSSSYYALKGSKFTSVTVNGKYIGYLAFYNCSTIKSIEISENV
nr:leucine-rich repeat domain-containing protein [Bacteroidaceae bacterium]